MELVLEYAGDRVEGRKSVISPFTMQLLLAYAHVNLCWQVSRLMIVSVCSHLHANFVAWTPVAWLPGDVVTYYFGRVAGIALMFMVSIVAGQLMYGVLLSKQTVMSAGAKGWLRDWRTWITAALWLGWVPVPALFAFAYQFSQWATERG